MFPMRPSAVFSIAMLALTAMLTGCGTTGTTIPTPYTPPAGSYTGLAFTSKVLSGSAPLLGVTVQLYAAGTTGNGSAPTQLLSSSLTTDSNGAFSVATGYTCPAATSIVYAVASGGHVNGGATNSSIVLMTVLGPCNGIASGASYTVNEVTTVASAYAMAQFLKPGAQLGATSTNTSGITLAAATVANLVNLTTGTAPGAGFPATGTAPTAKINALANAMHSCVVTSGAPNPACTQLLGDVVSSGTPPTNTLDAMLSLAKNAGTSVVPIYNLTLASSTFAPALTAAPDDWVMYATYGGGGLNAPSALALDSQGRVWVANYFSSVSLFANTGKPIFANGLTGSSLYESYGAAVDANDNLWVVDQETSGALNSGYGAITEFNSQGTNVTGSPYATGGVYYPYAVAVDSSNVSWVVDYGDSHLTLLSNSGTSLAGTSGFSGVNNGTSTLFFPVAIAVDSSRNGWVANFASNTITKISSNGTATAYVCCNAPDGLAIDGSGNVWVSNYYGDSISLLSASGTLLSGGFQGGGIVHPQGIAIDGVGNVWVASYRGPALSELAGTSSSSAAGTVLSPSAGWAPDANLLEAYALAIDAGGDVWVTGFGNSLLTEYIGMAAPVKTPLLGPVRVP
jgi:hypothetical protein